MPEIRFDLVQIRRDIEAEVRARRAAGVYPAGFERELDDLFARFAPPEASDDLDAAIDRVEEYIAIDPVIPTASRKPGIGLFKRLVAKLLGWYHAFVAEQVTAAGAATAHAIRLLGRRVEQMETVSGHAEHARVAVARVAPTRDDGGVERAAHRRVADVPRAESRSASAAKATRWLRSPAPGWTRTEWSPAPTSPTPALARGLEVRVDDAVGHLGTVAAGDLGRRRAAGVRRTAAGR